MLDTAEALLAPLLQEAEQAAGPGGLAGDEAARQLPVLLAATWLCIAQARVERGACGILSKLVTQDLQ